jgi:hypothetical protein
MLVIQCGAVHCYKNIIRKEISQNRQSHITTYKSDAIARVQSNIKFHPNIKWLQRFFKAYKYEHEMTLPKGYKKSFDSEKRYRSPQEQLARLMVDASFGRYAIGQKRCQVCSLFMKSDGLWCPCCG